MGKRGEGYLGNCFNSPRSGVKGKVRTVEKKKSEILEMKRDFCSLCQVYTVLKKFNGNWLCRKCAVISGFVWQ